MRKKITKELRQQAVSAVLLKGWNCARAGRHFGVTGRAVSNWVNQSKQADNGDITIPAMKEMKAPRRSRKVEPLSRRRENGSGDMIMINRKNLADLLSSLMIEMIK